MYCKAQGSAGAIRAGQGVMAGRLSSGIRQQLLKTQLCTVPVGLYTGEQFTERRVQWQMHLEQCGIVGGALGGIVATGMSLALMAAVLGTLGTCYFEVLCNGQDQSYIGRSTGQHC